MLQMIKNYTGRYKRLYIFGWKKLLELEVQRGNLLPQNPKSINLKADISQPEVVRRSGEAILFLRIWPAAAVLIWNTWLMQTCLCIWCIHIICQFARLDTSKMAEHLLLSICWLTQTQGLNATWKGLDQLGGEKVPDEENTLNHVSIFAGEKVKNEI